jgi:hypothetical protein
VIFFFFRKKNWSFFLFLLFSSSSFIMSENPFSFVASDYGGGELRHWGTRHQTGFPHEMQDFLYTFQRRAELVNARYHAELQSRDNHPVPPPLVPTVRVPRNELIPRETLTLGSLFRNPPPAFMPPPIAQDRTACSICQEQEGNAIFHLVCRREDKQGDSTITLCDMFYCEACVAKLDKCPQCRCTNITKSVDVERYKKLKSIFRPAPTPVTTMDSVSYSF